MTGYAAPSKDMGFALDYLVDLDLVLGHYPRAELSRDLVFAVIEQVGRVRGSVFAPLRPVGDPALAEARMVQRHRAYRRRSWAGGAGNNGAADCLKWLP